ncbi:hypothetical protein TMEN_8534 [Trichophyton mentagrophytes]|nr:hypothetical protein TMEN_8534 [Trichophyton mentagrophytes]
MAVTKSLLLALIFAAIMILASPTEESFITSSMVYIGPVTPGGENVTLEGSIQEIFHQILKLNPSYKQEDFHDTPDSHAHQVGTNLEKRIPGDIICDPSGTKRAWRKHIEEGVAYLKRAPQASLCRVRNRACSRISCSWDSGIFLCNDRDSWFEEFCPVLGNYADEILRGCQQSRTKVAGQKFDPQNYNVLVKFDKC